MNILISYRTPLVAILGSLLVVGGIVAFDSKRESVAARDTKLLSGLTATQTFHDFGVISMSRGKVSQRFVIENSSTESVTIRKIYTSCMCTVASFLAESGERLGPFGMPGHGPLPEVNLTLAPETQGAVEVVFDPAAHGPAGLGLMERVVRLETATGAGLELKIRARVTP